MIWIKSMILAATLSFSFSAHAGSGWRHEFERITTCEMQATVYNGDVLVKQQIFQRGGFTKTNGAVTCETAAIERVKALCKAYNKPGKRADTYLLGWNFKAITDDATPPPPACTSETDPRCLDGLFQAFKMETKAAQYLAGACSEYTPVR